MSKPSNQQQDITFPPFAPKLKLERRPKEKSGAKSAPERTRAEAEQPKKEPEVQAGRSEASAAESPADAARASTTPGRAAAAEAVAGEETLQGGWEQLHRARALFEAEQESVQRVRIGQRDFEQQLKRREAEVAAREAAVTAREQAVAEREARVASATPPADSTTPPAEESVVTRLTRAPFAIARSVLGQKEKSAPAQPET